MAVSNWTSHYEATIRADVDSVLAWWTSPQRRDDQRAHFESLDVQNFSYEESSTAEARLTEMSWTTSEGLFVSLRIEFPHGQDGNIEHAVDGGSILRSRTSQQRRWPGGRQESSSTSNVTEFRQAQPGTTQLRLTTTRQKAGAWSWERYMPPIAERRQQRQHLRQMVAQCEHDLGVI